MFMSGHRRSSRRRCLLPSSARYPLKEIAQLQRIVSRIRHIPRFPPGDARLRDAKLSRNRGLAKTVRPEFADDVLYGAHALHYTTSHNEVNPHTHKLSLHTSMMGVCETVKELVEMRRAEFHPTRSENAVAEEIGMEQSTLTRITHGSTPNPSVKTLGKIAKFFGVTVDDITAGRAPELYASRKAKSVLPLADSAPPPSPVEYFNKHSSPPAWPFARIEASRFARLPEKDQAYIEWKLLELIAECEERSSKPPLQTRRAQ